MSDNVISFPSLRRSSAGGGLKAHSFEGKVNEDISAGAKVCAAEATRELTPVIFPYVPLDVRKICTEQLGCPEVIVVQVLPIPDAHPRHYVANIAREMLTQGGRPVFGWRIRHSPLHVAAEFYAMHQTDSSLVDVTPNTRGEHFVCFAPDYDVPPDFDFLDRPPTRRFSTYVAPTTRDRVNSEMALMDSGVLEYERIHAANKGLALEDAISLKLGPDKLETSLDLFIECSEELEKLTMAVMDGFEALNLERYDFLQRRKVTLETLVNEEFAQHRIALAQSPAYPRQKERMTNWRSPTERPRLLRLTCGVCLRLDGFG